MTEEEFLHLATKVVSNEATKDEIARYHFYCKQKKHAAMAKRIQSQWNAVGTGSTTTAFNPERGLRLLEEKIQWYQPSFRWEESRHTQPHFVVSSRWVRFAVSVAVVLILLAGGIMYFMHQSNELLWNEKKTMMGEKSIVTMPDGTVITLNADSRLLYPSHFGDRSREVYLQGEAYFDVRHHAGKPFIVHTEHVSTTDIGTMFDVKAFPSEKNITISLEQGSVEVSSDTTPASHAIVLHPSQQVVYNKAQNKSIVTSFNLERTSGWKNNILIFDDEPIAEVLRSLERSYGVSFQFADTTVLQHSLRAHFHNEPLATVVKALEKATGLTSKTVGNQKSHQTIIFSERSL